LKVNETDEDRRNWMIVAILSIPLILIFLTFGEPYYESLDIVGKRAFMLAFQIVFSESLVPCTSMIELLLIFCDFPRRNLHSFWGAD
jgi:hypothetical protein